MAKTPFEVRLDLLKIAQDQVNQSYFSQCESRRISKMDFSDLEFPTLEKVIEEAQKLKLFVDSN